MVKPFKVDFKFISEDSASTIIIAETPEAAREGALLILAEEGYTNGVEVTNVEVYSKKQHQQTLQ